MNASVISFRLLRIAAAFKFGTNLKEVIKTMENTTLVKDVNSVAMPIEDLDDAVRLVDLVLKVLFSRLPTTLNGTYRRRPAKRNVACWKILRSAVSLICGS